MLLNFVRGIVSASLVAGLAAQATIATVPPSSTVDLAPAEVVNRIVRVCLPGAVPPTSQVDVYILADTTGSMGSTLAAVQTNVAAIVTALLANPAIRIGIGNYKDFPSDPYCFQHQQSSTDNQVLITAAINAWSADGGADTPEGQFFALHQISTDPAVGFRPLAKRIIVWFGDAPGHDPVCAAISGLGFAINEASLTTTLTTSGPGGTTVIAISVASGPSLNGNPGGAGDYGAACGAVTTGLPGQATRIAAATGGLDLAIGPPGAIVAAILNSVTTVLTVVDVSLAIAGPMAPFITNVTPPVHLGVVIPPNPGDQVCVDFNVEFTGLPCSLISLFPGTFEALADGAGTGAILPYSVTQDDCGVECFALFGFTPLSVNLGSPGDVLFVNPITWFAVTLASIPDIDIPNDPNLAGLHVYSQIVMYNPAMYPADPLHLTQGLDATLGGLVPHQFGSTNAMQIWSTEPSSLGGKLRVRFSLP